MKNLTRILPALILLNMSNVCASTNKTFLMPRPQGVNLPIEKTIFMELVNRKSHKKFGGNLGITTFYQRSESKNDVAAYFLVKNKSTIDFNASPNKGADSNKTSWTNDVDPTYINHRRDLDQKTATTENALHNTLNLAPQQTVWALQFDYKQDLRAVLTGLYAYVHMPIAYVQNKTDLTFKSDNPQVATDMKNLFNGTFHNTDPLKHDLGAYLTNAKIGGQKTAIGFADIDLGLGYTFLNQERYNAAIAIAFTIPTGNKAKGEYLFEPIYGNGNHFALGADLCGQARLVGSFEHNLKINVAGKYRYLFEHNEQRTLGIKGREFGQYFLLGKSSTLIEQELIPAANVLTLPVDVTPGNQFDGIASLTYNRRGLTIDFGYNLYYRESEKINLRSIFPDNTYAIAARGFDTATAFTINTANVDGGNTGNIEASIINDDTIDTDAAATSEQWANGIYMSFGYVSRGSENPWMLGIGGKYDFASKNSVLEQWNIWLKTGVGF